MSTLQEKLTRFEVLAPTISNSDEMIITSARIEFNGRSIRFLDLDKVHVNEVPDTNRHTMLLFERNVKTNSACLHGLEIEGDALSSLEEFLKRAEGLEIAIEKTVLPQRSFDLIYMGKLSTQ